MKNFVLFLLLPLAFACTSSKHSTGSAASLASTGGDAAHDGTSYATAVVITEKHEQAGVDAEYKWVREHYPGSKNKGQSLTRTNNKPYDILTIVTVDGEEKKIYFDIFNFFGKF